MRSAILITAVVLAAVATAQTVVPYKPNLRLHPFTSLPQQNYSLIQGATVSVDQGFASGDQLMMDYEGEYQISSTYDSMRGVLYIQGLATVSEYINAIETVVFSTTATDGKPRQLVWALGANTFFLPETGHSYSYYANVGVSWNASLANCATYNYFGMPGYMATITSSQEMTGLASKLASSAWIGGAPDVNNQWSWQAGPEAGTAFWSGLSMYAGGVAVDEEYTAWGRFQPDGYNAIALVPSLYEATGTWKNMNNMQGVSGYLCEFGDMPTTATLGTYGGAVLLEYGCSLFTNAADCGNQASVGCTWNGMCIQSSCVQYTTELLCTTNALCQWSVDSGVGLCTATPCGVFSNDESTCVKATGCAFAPSVNGADTCYDAECSDYATSSSCAGSATGCTWHLGRCATTAGLNCTGLDIIYVIDGSALMAQPFGLHSSGYVGIINVLARADEVLTQRSAVAVPQSTDFGQRVGYVLYGSSKFNGVTPTGTGTGGRLTGDATQKSQDLAYLEALFPASSTRTLTQAMTQVNSMVQNSGSVAAGRQVIVVVIAAGAISDAAAVQSMLASWSYTFIGVALSQYPESSLSSQAAVQSLGAALPKKSNIFELSIDDFTDSIIWGICSTMSKPSTGVPTCAVYTTASACWQDPTCGWSSASMVCETSACLAHDATSCKADSTCSWDSNNKFCRSACSGTSASNCGPCVTNPSEDSCIGDPNGCVYNASNYIKCQLDNCAPITNPTACAAQPNCIFTSQSICMLDPCTSRTKAGQAFCQALPQCSWTNIQGTQYGCRLGTPCGGYQGEKACAGDSRCQWSVDISPSACVPAPCMKYNANPLTAPALCMADSACMWRLANQTGVGQAMCMVRTCDMYSTACACSADDGCVWRNNTCKDSRYVQCPAIDIFFLVEGTSVMAKEFGRHPNGFVGIIESIRGWSMDAPWSPDTTSTGFRMGMALYGGNTAQLTPGNGIGNGEDFVMKPSDWYGATKELDFFENSFSSYAAGATGVQLRPGLAAAKNMFTRSDPSRTKMLVILGVSPFTDGSSPDTAIAPAIKDLEAMGVQIFSNIVRRFGSITDAETLASSYMTPVASEPSSSHFLFATIDEIRSTLLDQFCDPSTTTGQALGVSRDNTLPCSWLAQNECSMQTNCVWNASGVKTCPLPTQCPNLGCDPLPTNLASTFTCAQCTKVSGAISCQSTPVASTKGTCQPNSCALNYCGMSTCNADTNCLWNSDTVRCEANLCGPITNVDTCNAQLGCYWNALSSPSACMRSDSWRQRSQVSCTAVTVTQNKNQLVIYRWKTDVQPAVCIQKRCENFDQTLCQSHTSSEGCYYDPSNLNGQTCLRQTCPYTNSLDCHSDSNCYWNPFDTLLGTCSPVPQDGSCVLSGYSNYTQCTASCGNAIQTKSRRILRFPKTSAASLSCANVAVNMGRATGETTIVITQPCNVDASCTAHCGAIKNSLTCSKDISCYWNATCLPKTFHSCAEYDQSLCVGMDVCAWNSVTSFCEPVVTVCTLFNTSQTCALATATQNCHWRTGATINSMGAQYNAPTQLFNPGPLQEPIFVFPTLSLSSSDIIWGATVTIEQNFQRGKDQLQLLYPSAMQTSWDPTSGTLSLTGRGTINDYANAIRYVTFTSVSVDTSARLVTWSLLNNTVYSAVTGHVYRYYPATGISFTNAQALCSQASFFGMQGYLAVVQTQHENDMLFQKLWAAGWLGAGDLSSGVWRWNTGPFAGAPLAFWQGPSAAAGGRNVGGYFANWNTIVDEPNQTAVGTNGLYMDSIGTWHAEPTNWVGGAGYICEFGGMVNDATPAFDVYGTAVVGAAGCLPDECTYHNNQTGCTLDTDCYWNNNRCQLACSGYSTPLQCGTNTNCAWDDTVVPPMCAFNPCSGPNSNNCTNPQCVWDQGQNLCVFRTGCAARLDATSCSNYAACVWNSGACEQKPCSSLSSADDCGANPLCLYVTGTGCTTAYCRAGNQGDCESDSRCEWNAVTSTASVSFTPGGSPVQPFTTLATPGSVGNLVVDGITVMITGGFEEGMDTLTVNSAVLSSSSWTMNWNSQSGTLILYAPPATMALDAVSFLQNYVTFYSTSGANQARTIAYSLGVNSFMGTNGNKFIKYVPATTGNAPTTFAAAQTLCSNTQFFGASGQLASLTNELDALNLARLSPTGWLGAQAVNNKWTWTDNGATFWDISAGKPGPITASNGTSFGYWAKSQPLFAQSSATQYAVVSSSGMWSTLVAGRNQGLGAICEYPVPSGIVGSTRTAMPSGCFMKPCVGLGQGTCLTTPGCSWNIDSNNPNTCSVDTFCDAAPTPSNCTALAGCYWSYSYSYCATASATTCDKYTTQATCEQTSNTYCEWASNKLARGSNSLGACVSTACGPLTPDACVGNPLCVLQGTTCLIRQCPYVSPKFCFQDPSCNWDYSSSTCFPDACTYNGDQNTCAAQSACYWSNNQCFRTSCVGTTAATCQKVPYCIFTAGICTKTTCYQLTGTACINNANCNWITDSTTNQLTCITARCKAYSNSNDCASSNTTGSTCSWSNGQCIQGAAPASCQKQVSPNLWWLYLLCLIILVLLGLIAWRLYLAYSKGLSFFEPARTNVKYSPHAQYAADLFEEAQTTAVESNAPGYQRPNINDL